MQVGDTITEVNDYAIWTDQDFNFALSLASLDATGDTATLDFEVKRGDETLRFDDVPVDLRQTEDGKSHIVLDFYVVGE